MNNADNELNNKEADNTKQVVHHHHYTPIGLGIAFCGLMYGATNNEKILEALAGFLGLGLLIISLLVIIVWWRNS